VFCATSPSLYLILNKIWSFEPDLPVYLESFRSIVESRQFIDLQENGINY